MAQIDKYVPLISGTRAALDVPLAAGDLNKVIGVGLNANGRVVKGPGVTGIIGALVCTRMTNYAGAIVDVGQNMDVVGDEFTTAATVYYFVESTGVLTAASTGGAVPTGGVYCGHTVEAKRLVVRFQKRGITQ